MSSPHPVRAAIPPAKAVLSVRRLRVEFAAARWIRSGPLQAVEDLHFDLAPGETLGILGEPGSGKTTLARALAGLQPIDSGGVVFDGQDLARTHAGWRPVRRRIQMLFADPRDSLDPRLTVAQSIHQPLEALCPELDAAAREARIFAMLEELGAATIAARRPAELSDDECRSACLARALAVQPDILLCDEPASSLGAPRRRDLIERIELAQRDYGLAVVMTAAEPLALSGMCARLLVMSVGRVLEQGSAAQTFARPRHPYTKALLDAALPAERPDAANPPSGCVFRTRCAMADELCARETPYLRRVSESGYAACHYVHGAADEEKVGDARTRA